jgi:hypothetical protein
MIRVTIEMLPKGDASRARPIGLIEIANIGVDGPVGSYRVFLSKCPPFKGALKAAWRRGTVLPETEDEEVIVGAVEGFHRQKRGVYDLLFRALKSCGLEARNA